MDSTSYDQRAAGAPPNNKRKSAADEIRSQRIRTKQACEACRRRRRKCDGRFPCTQCLSYSYDCEYLGRPRRRTGRGIDRSHDIDLDDDPVGASEHLQTTQRPEKQRNETSPTTIFSTPISTAPGKSPQQEPVSYVDPIKGRFASARSAVAFPRRLGLSMKVDPELRLHSYGWNLNTGPEISPALPPSIVQYLTLQDVTKYGHVFFDVVDPVFHIISQRRYFDRCSKHWTNPVAGLEDFEALVAGVVSLGSFFSQDSSPVEAELVDLTKIVLDRGCSYSPGHMSLYYVAAGILRTLYLRLTTRPFLSWFSSAATMHIAEAMALHIDLREAHLVGGDLPTSAIEVIECRKRLLECAVFLNTFFSMEYGRSRVSLKYPQRYADDPHLPIARITQILWKLEEELSPDSRIEILQSIQKIPDEPPVLCLLKTDAVLELYRRHLAFGQGDIGKTESAMILSFIGDGLAKTRVFLPEHQPWWNILATPFQSLMVLLAMDTDECLALSSEAMSVLQAVFERYPTYLAGEVLVVSQSLIRSLQKRKMDQWNSLERTASLDVFSKIPLTQLDEPEAGPPSLPGEALFDTWLTGGVNWTQLLGGGWTGNQAYDGLNIP